MLINGKSLDAICSLTPYPIDEFIHVSAEVLSLADPEITVRFDNHEDGTSDLYLALTNPIEEIDVTSVKNAILKKYDDKLKKVSVYQIPKNPVNSYETWMKNGKIFHEMHHAKVHEAPLLFEVTGKAQKNYDFTEEMQSAYQPISDPTDQIRREEKQRVNNFKFFREGDRLLDKPLYFHSKMHVWQVVARVREYIDAGFNPVFIEVDPKTKAAKPNEKQKFLKEYKSMALFEKLMNNREFKRTGVKKEKHFDRDYPGEIFNAKNPNIKVSEKKNKKQKAKVENAKVEKVESVKTENTKAESTKAEKVEKVESAKVESAKVESAKIENAKVENGELKDFPIIDGVPLVGNSEAAKNLHDNLVEKMKREEAEKLKEQNEEKPEEKTEEVKNKISEIELNGKKVKVEDYHGTKFNLETGKPIFFELEPKYDTSKLDDEIVQKAKATECYIDKHCKVVYAGGIKMPYGIKPSDFELLAAKINGTCEKLLPQKVERNNSFNLNSGDLEEIAAIADYTGIPKSRLIDKAIESTTDKKPILSTQYEKHLLDEIVKDSFKNAQVDYIAEEKLVSIQTNELSVTGDDDLSYSEKCRIVSSFRPAIENILVIYGNNKKFSKVTVEEALAYEAEHKPEENHQQTKIPYFNEEQIKNEMPLTDEEQSNFDQIKKEQDQLLAPENLIRYQETFDTLSGVEGTKIKFVNKALVLLVPDNKLEHANAEPDSSIADGSSIINYVITRAYPVEKDKIKEVNEQQVIEQVPQIDLENVKKQAAQITLNTGLTLDQALIALNDKMSKAYGVPVACQIKGDKFVVNLAKKDADKADTELLKQFEDEIFKTIKSVGVNGVTSVGYRTDFETVERINYTKEDLDNVRNVIQKVVNGKFAALNYIDIDPRFGGAIMIQSPTMGDTFFELGREWFDKNTSNLITLAFSVMDKPKQIYELLVVNTSQKAIYRHKFNMDEIDTNAINKMQKQLKADAEKANVQKDKTNGQDEDYETNEDGVSVVNENFFNLGNDNI